MPTTLPPVPFRSIPRRGLMATVLATAALSAGASPEKAAKFYEAALQRYEQNDLPGTVVQLKNALQEDRKKLAAQLLLGKVLLKSGELKAAEAALEEALRQGVSPAEVAVPLGQVYLALGEPKKLLDSIVTTGTPPALHAEILTLRGSAHALLGNLAPATQSLAEARAADPKSAQPLIAEAPLLLLAGEREKARSTALRATELAPGNPGAWYVLGAIQQSLSDSAGALASYGKALALNAKQVDARLGRVSLLLGQNRDVEADQDLAQLRAWGVADPRASFLRALLAARRGDQKTAKAEYTQAANLTDAVPAAVRSSNEPLLMSGVVAHRALGNLEKSREYLEAMLARNPKNFSAQLFLASTLVDTQDFVRAMPILETLRAAAPDDPNVSFLIGSIYLARKQFAQASEYFEKSAQRMPSGDAARELGFSQFGLGLDKAALASLEQAYASNPKDLRAATELAVAYARLGQPTKAVQTAEAVVKNDPNNLTMLNFLATTKGLVGDMAGARLTYEQAVAKDPLFRPSSINLSWMDIDAGRFDLVRSRLQKLLQARPDDAEVLFQLGVLEARAKRPQAAVAAWVKANELQRSDPRAGLALMDLYASLRQNDQALALAKGMVAKFPQSVGLQLALSRAHFNAKDPAQGKQALVEATRLAGFDAAQQVLIGRTQLQVGNPDDAAINAAKALQSRPGDRDALVLLVEIEAKRGNAAGVSAALKTLTAKHPDAPATMLATGAVALSRGQFPAAAASFRAAMDKQPAAPTAMMLAQALVANKETDKAQSVLDDWARKHPKDELALRALAEVQLLAGNAAGARKSHEQIIAIEPDNPGSQASYALLLLRLNDPAAKAAAEKAYKLAPANPELADLYGWIMVLQGQPEAGTTLLREARLRDPANGALRFHLAFALNKAGKKAEAKEELGAALAGTTTLALNPEVKKLKSELGI